MARPTDNSLKYYNRDVTDDDSLKYIQAVHGIIGWAVIEKLRQKVYGNPNGYYIPWNKIVETQFCADNGIEVEFFKKVIESCFDEDICLFDRGMFEQHKILTGRGIQKRWQKIVKECGRKNNSVEELYRLISLQSDNPQETTPPTMLISEETTQNKIKESKVNKNISEYSHKNNFLKSEKENTSEKGLPSEKFIIPSHREVREYFENCLKEKWNDDKIRLQWQKFYSHYKGLGWKSTAGATILDWRGAADKWILNEETEKFKNKNSDKITEIFIQDLYEDHQKGNLKEGDIPGEIYNYLIDKKIFDIPKKKADEIFARCNGDAILAKKRTVVFCFDGLIKIKKERVFDIKK